MAVKMTEPKWCYDCNSHVVDGACAMCGNRPIHMMRPVTYHRIPESCVCGNTATHVRVQHTRVIGQCQSCVLDATLLASSVTLH